MKICRVCKIQKTIENFNKSRKKKDGTYHMHTICKKCHSDYIKQHYKNNKKAHQKYLQTSIEYGKNLIKTYKDYTNKLKTEIGCLFCKENHYACLDFHHIKKNEKISDISTMIYNHVSFEKLKIELLKCVVVCSNCHRKIHMKILPEPQETLQENQLLEFSKSKKI